MHPLVLMPLVACVVCSAYCLTATPATYDMGSRRPFWLGKLLFACPAMWAFAEMGMAVAPDAESARAFLPLISFASVMIAPVAVDTAQTMSARQAGRIVPATRGLYAVAAALIVLDWLTHAAYSGVVAVPWGGFVFESGPLHPAYLVFAAGCGVYAFFGCRRLIRDSQAIEEIPGSRGLSFCIALVIFAGATTDGILPILGIQTPRLATSAFAVLAAALLWAMSRPEGYVFASQQTISREILRSIHEGVVFVTLDDRVLLANEGMETFLGMPATDLVGRPFQQHLPEVTLSEPQERIDVECPLVAASGRRMKVSASVSTARDSRGEPLGLVVVVRDLRQVELLRRQLVTSGRLAAVGELAAGIAHEINNPLSFIRTNLGVLREHWSTIGKALESETPDRVAREALVEVEEIITESIEGVDRAASIVRDVREFSHAGTADREHVDVNELLDRVLHISNAEIPPAVRIERAYADVPPVLASPQQLKQVFLNLLVNAIHAVECDGTIRLGTSRERDRVVVRVIDDGLGIEPDVAERIFDPFFTTKEVGKGTGIGLSISHEIVRSHGGELSLERAGGPGACLRVELPVAVTRPTPQGVADRG